MQGREKRKNFFFLQNSNTVESVFYVGVNSRGQPIFFSGLWGRSFFSSIIGIIFLIIKHMIVHMFAGMLIRGQGLSTKATNIVDSTVMRKQLSQNYRQNRFVIVFRYFQKKDFCSLSTFILIHCPVILYHDSIKLIVSCLLFLR